MPKPQKALQQIVTQLETAYGRPEPPRLTDPLELILYENVAYLVDDERREQAFDVLRKRVGLKPPRILSASSDVLMEVARLGGMQPEGRVKKLQTIARITQYEFDGDLTQALKLPLAQARRALKKYPGIGDPGADKILLFTKTHPLFALESNGLRALIRLGFGEEMKDYAATYRSVMEAVKDQLSPDYGWLIRAHQLLRQHGQELCRRSHPLCHSCTLAKSCRFYRAGATTTHQP